MVEEGAMEMEVVGMMCVCGGGGGGGVGGEEVEKGERGTTNRNVYELLIKG